MKTLSNIKKDLEFNRGLSSLIEVLKTIAVAQYRFLEKKIKSYEKLVSNIESFFELVDIKNINHPFLNGQDKLLVVAVTSDSGLLGGLNMQVVNQALFELGKTPGKLIVIGERGKAYVKEGNVPFTAFSGIRDEDRHEQAGQLRDYVVDRILEGSFGQLKVVYPKPISFTIQKVVVDSFLPYTPSFADTQADTSQIILESKPEDIIEYLLYTWIAQKFDEIFGLSRLAEFAARFVHLEGSHQRLRETDAKVRLEYFRVRHEIIDRNMRELFAARLLYAS